MKRSSILLSSVLIALLSGCGDTGNAEKDESPSVEVVDAKVNAAPVATFDTFSISRAAKYDGQLTATDADGDTLKYIIVTQPQHGTVVLHDNGCFTYTSDEGYVGTDTFSYKASDDVSTCAVKTVTVNVKAPTTTVPSAPSNLQVKALSTTKLELTWKDNASNEEGFAIYKDGKLVATTKANETRKVLCCGLEAGKTYDFEVKAKNEAGLSSPATAQGTTKDVTTPPNAPTELKAKAVDKTSLRLEWKDNADNESGYEIYQDGVKIKTISSGCHCTVITGLTEGTEYSFEVKAINKIGSASSNSLSIKTAGGIVTPPVNHAPTAKAGTDVSITAGESVTLNASASSDSDGDITSYEWKEGATVLSTNASFTKSDFTVGTHTISLKVTDNDGASATDTVVVVVKEVADTIKPVITVGSDITITEGESIDDAKLLAGVSATDNKDGNVNVTIKSKGGLDSSKAGTYTITYEAKDAAGNVAQESKKVIVTAIEKLDIIYHDSAGIAKLNSGYGEFGKHPVGTKSIHNSRYDFKDEYKALNLQTVLYYPKDINGPRPTLFYYAGWHHYNPDDYKALLNFVASKGYNIIFMTVPDVNLRQLPDVTQDAIDAFSDQIDKTKVGFIGHSMGAGEVYWLVKEFENLGTEGRLIFPMAPGYTVFNAGVIPKKQEIDIPSNTKMIEQMYASDFTTDIRIGVDIFNNSTILDKDKEFMLVYGDEQHIANHSPMRTKADGDYDSLMQRTILRPLDALMDEVFNGNEQAIDTMKQEMQNDPYFNPYIGNTPQKDIEEKYILPIQDYQYNCIAGGGVTSVRKEYCEFLVFDKAPQPNKAPTAKAGADVSITAGESVTLNASASSDSDGEIASYEWKEEATVLSTNASFTKSDFTVGTHTITLTVTDNDGASATDTVVVVVKEAQADNIQALLDSHNNARHEVGINSDMQWSDTIAGDAQLYADEMASKGIWGHDTERNQNDGYGHGNYGENLYASTANNVTFAEASDSWIGEKAYYTYGKVGDANTCEDGKMCGHYTQIIWKDTTHVGCAKSTYKVDVFINGTNFKGASIVVCKYQIPGNWLGQTPY